MKGWAGLVGHIVILGSGSEGIASSCMHQHAGSATAIASCEVRTLSTISWKCTVTFAWARFLWLVELWMSSDTLLKRNCRRQTAQYDSVLPGSSYTIRRVANPHANRHSNQPLQGRLKHEMQDNKGRSGNAEIKQNIKLAE